MEDVRDRSNFSLIVPNLVNKGRDRIEHTPSPSPGRRSKQTPWPPAAGTPEYTYGD